MKLRLRVLGGLVDLKLNTSPQHGDNAPVDGPPFGFSGGGTFDTERGPDEPESGWHG